MTLARPSLELLEGRTTPAWTGPLPADVALLPTAEPGRFRVLDLYNGSDIGDLRPFPDGFTGEVRSATGDVTGDGTPDLVVAAGAGGGPRVVVFDGATGAVSRDFFALEKDFRGGVYVAVGDVNHDGAGEIIVGAGEGGGPRVRVFDGRTDGVLADFFAYEASFRGGVRVAAGDVDGDGTGPAEVVAGAGPGGGARVRVFGSVADGKLPAEVSSFLAYDAAFRGGVYVATAGAGRYAVSSAGDIYVGPAAKIITGSGAGAAPVAKVFDGAGREYFVHTHEDAAAADGLRVSGADHGYLYESAGSVGFSIYGERTGGWVIPLGTTRVTGFISAIDQTAGTLTIRTYRGDEHVVRVRPETSISRFGLTSLASLFVGDGASAVLGADGVATRISTLPAPVPGLQVPAPTP